MTKHIENDDQLNALPEEALDQELARRDFLKIGGVAVLGAAVVTPAFAKKTIYTDQSPTGLPPEFTAPAETLKPGVHDSDLYIETTGYDKDNQKVTTWIGRNTAGITVGLVQLRAMLPMIPGHVGNGTTFNFPLLYSEMLPPDPYKIMAMDPNKEKVFVDEAVKAAKWLELQGVSGIVGNCGFFGTYQTVIQEQIDTPFWSSSLVQLPTILTCLPKRRKVGVITANAPVLRDGPAIENCGVSVKDKKERIVIEGAEGPEFNKVLNQTGEPFNVLKLEKEIVDAARRIMKRDKNIGAFLLECTELSAAAYAVQGEVRLPVYDYCTMVRAIHDGARARRYTGFV
jgi:hypothetical protein